MQAEYMTAVGEDDPFLNCSLFNNDEFRAFRKSARIARNSFGIDNSHHAQIERAVPLVATAIRQIQHEGVQQRVSIMEGIMNLTGKLDNLIATNQSLDSGFLRIDRGLQQVVHDQRVFRNDVLHAHVLTTNSQVTGHMAQASASWNQANVMNQTALLVSSMMNQPGQQIIQPLDPQATLRASSSTMSAFPIDPAPTIQQQLLPIQTTFQNMAEPTPAPAQSPVPTLETA
ncbi:UNVERIFIED_CONTAM: hypothetical protein HDU68_005886, partial [Siphonaria sp. JEL0065]